MHLKRSQWSTILWHFTTPRIVASDNTCIVEGSTKYPLKATEILDIYKNAKEAPQQIHFFYSGTEVDARFFVSDILWFCKAIGYRILSFDKSDCDSWPEYEYNLKQEYNVGITLEKWWNNKRLKMSLSCGICCYLCYNQMTMMIIAFYLNPLTWIGPIFSNPYEALPSDVYMYILSFL